MTDDTGRPERPGRAAARGRRALVVSGRVVGGLVGAAVAVVVVGAVLLVPRPEVTRAAPLVEVASAQATATRTCAGAFLLSGADPADPESLTAVADGLSVVGASATPDAVDSTELAPPAGSAVPALSFSAPIDSPLAGGQAQDVDVTDARGLAASACAAPGQDAWLVAGRTTVGETGVVVLTNPSSVPATVDLELFGPEGALSAPGSGGIVVPAEGQRAFALAGLAPGLESVVVHVTARGGLVAAQLQQSTVDTLTPVGADAVSATTLTGQRLVIPGVVLANTSSAPAVDEHGNPLDSRLVRLFVPGTEAAAVTITSVPDGGAQGTVLAETRVEPGRVADVLLDTIPTGAQTLVVTSDRDVVAGAFFETIGDERRDYAWAQPAPALPSSFAIAVPSSGVGTVLRLYNGGEEAVDVTVAPAPAGAPQTLQVAPGATASLPIPAAGAYVAQATGPLHAALSMAGDGRLAVIPILAPDEPSAPILVHPR